jgi:RimJ/RimL family protein N-acetyltransferase
MLGGVRDTARAAAEMADDIRGWGARGWGIWAVHERTPNNGPNGRAFVGITGLMLRPDGRGVALRFAFWPEAQGRGLAREAAAAALAYAHGPAGLDRVVAVTRESNFASRTLLGGIGMRVGEAFVQNGWPMLLYVSQRIR